MGVQLLERLVAGSANLGAIGMTKGTAVPLLTAVEPCEKQPLQASLFLLLFLLVGTVGFSGLLGFSLPRHLHFHFVEDDSDVGIRHVVGKSGPRNAFQVVDEVSHEGFDGRTLRRWNTPKNSRGLVLAASEVSPTTTEVDANRFPTGSDVSEVAAVTETKVGSGGSIDPEEPTEELGLFHASGRVTPDALGTS